MQTHRNLTLGLGLLALAPLTAAASDLRVQLVDAADRPLESVDVFVYDADGTSLLSALDASGPLSTSASGDFVTLHLPQYGAVLDVPLAGATGAEITVRVSPDKGYATLTGVKPFSPAVAFGTAGAPPNDDCANAIPIANGDTPFSTVGATTDNTIGSNSNDIWFAYTAPGSGVVTFSTCDQANYDTDLLLLTADSTCGAQTALGINDDSFPCANNTSILNVGVAAGQTYLLSLGGFSSADVGSGTLSVSFVEAAANDDCAGAEPVAVGSSVTFSNSASTTSASDPAFSCIFNGPAQGFGSTWFSFVAETDTVLLSTENSTGSTDTVVGVYSGGCGSLVEVACGEDIDFDNLNFLSRVVANGLTPGAEYLVQVCSFSEASAGQITLDVLAGPLVAPYNGSGINTASLTLTASALIGEDAVFQVEPATGPTMLRISLQPAQFVLDPFGEILISLNAKIESASADGQHVLPVTDNPALIGRVFYAQALVVDSSEVTNAVEFELGGF